MNLPIFQEIECHVHLPTHPQWIQIAHHVYVPHNTRVIMRYDLVLIFSGHLYNYKQLYSCLGKTLPTKDSSLPIEDIILDYYIQYGMEYTLSCLDSTMTMILIDYNLEETYAKLYVVSDRSPIQSMYYTPTDIIHSFVLHNNPLLVSCPNTRRLPYGICEEYRLETHVMSQWTHYQTITYSVLNRRGPCRKGVLGWGQHRYIDFAIEKQLNYGIDMIISQWRKNVDVQSALSPWSLGCIIDGSEISYLMCFYVNKLLKQIEKKQVDPFPISIPNMVLFYEKQPNQTLNYKYSVSEEAIWINDEYTIEKESKKHNIKLLFYYDHIEESEIRRGTLEGGLEYFTSFRREAIQRRSFLPLSFYPLLDFDVCQSG